MFVCVCVRVCAHVGVFAFECACVRVCGCVHMFVRMCMCMSACACACVWARARAFALPGICSAALGTTSCHTPQLSQCTLPPRLSFSFLLRVLESRARWKEFKLCVIVDPPGPFLKKPVSERLSPHRTPCTMPSSVLMEQLSLSEQGRGLAQMWRSDGVACGRNSANPQG
jgi:hypothetical protein